MVDGEARAGADRVRMSFPFWATANNILHLFPVVYYQEIKAKIKKSNIYI